jgi:predicted permease
LLTVQTGLTFTLLIESGLLVHSFVLLRNTDPGFDTKHLVSFALNSRIAGPGGNFSPTLLSDLEERVRELPGVSDASLSTGAIMTRIGMKTSVGPAGQRLEQQSFLNATLNYASDTYFDTLRMPIIAGRVFSADDEKRVAADSNGNSGPMPVVVNQAFARVIFSTDQAIGRVFGQGPPGATTSAQYQVVAIVGDSKYRSMREPHLPIFYVPWDARIDASIPFVAVLYVRTSGLPSGVIGEVEKTMYSIEPRLPFFNVITMKDQIRESLWEEQLLAALSILFAGISIVMALTGLYGLLSYESTLRTREFGIRAALGAQRRDLAMLLIKQVSLILATGCILGALICLAATHIANAVLYGVQSSDLFSFVSALLVIVTIGIFASWRPIVRASNVQTASVLHDE